MARDASGSPHPLVLVQQRLRLTLAPCLDALFDEFESRLFELAERSRVAARQHAYFDGMRESRRRRAGIEHDFLESVEALLRPDSAGAATGLRSVGLALVEHDEFEETMAIAALADRTEQRLEARLQPLERRLDSLLGSRAPEADGARLGPQRLGRLFRAACQRLDVGVELRVIALTLFGHHVFGALDDLYARLNALLIEAGVLPQLEAEPGAGLRSPRRGTQAPRRDPAPPAPWPGTEASDEEVQDMFDSVLNLLAESPGALHAANSASPRLAGRSLARALDRFGGFDDAPRQLKARLLETSREIESDPGALFSRADEDTIDMVGLLFDCVRHDPVLPQPLQPLMGRLQVPFLRAALEDPGLLSSPDHPARRLLDDLGDLALGWSPASDPDRHLFERMRDTVETLRRHGEAGRAAFERALHDLQTHLDVTRRRAELAEQRAVEAALGRERLRIARSRVAAALERRLAGHGTLPWVRQIVRGPWANVLVLYWLRQGETGEWYRDALRFVDDLLWCDAQGHDRPDPARLDAAGDGLEEELRHGLGAIAIAPAEIDQLGRELRQILAHLRDAQALPDFAYELDPRLASMDFGRSWAEPDLEDQPGSDRGDDALAERLRVLTPGTWFEFGPAGLGERAKLCWTSPFSGRCLFVTRTGLRAREASPQRLAADIGRGETRVLNRAHLLQRALQSLLARVRDHGPAALRASA